MCFSSRKNCELKVKLMSWSSRKKKGHFLQCLFYPKSFFFNICILFQCLVYLINFQNIYTFTYQKTLLHTLLLFFLKIAESLHCTLKFHIWENFASQVLGQNALVQSYCRIICFIFCLLDCCQFLPL